MMSKLRAEADAASPLQVAVDLVYTTDSSCRSVRELPSSSDALATRLMPANAGFRGNLQLSKAASGDGCALYLTVKGAVSATSTDFQNGFDVARSVHHQLTELLSAKWIENVNLARAAVALDGDKLLAVSLTAEDANATPESMLTVQQGACTELLNALKSKDDVDLLPRQVETSPLDVIKQTDADEAASCAVSLDVAGFTPRFSSDAEAFQLLKAVDEKMESFFAGQPSATLTSANVRLHVASVVAQNVSMEMESENVSSLKFNAPSYEEALGIFALVAVLVAMMMGVVAQKKRNDQRSRERYDRANRAAQIRRVSIRMSQYDQENQEYEGEEDNLL
ncbi:hypothetical protein GN958_ATG01633 [Phytophthora infestans]|uniref:Uncharacterized protein n=1 Tax=Phytophthora infestans TaxID=4787 RepID=A0A8S9UMD3_PHYIN|nr:hypothetical protein GN958_ATG10166 [Phytophthora infestans]KAF4149179.1 hypothetical protein GN958_ATG01633 [Phytophthora infestans]